MIDCHNIINYNIFPSERARVQLCTLSPSARRTCGTPSVRLHSVLSCRMPPVRCSPLDPVVHAPRAPAARAPRGARASRTPRLVCPAAHPSRRLRAPRLVRPAALAPSLTRRTQRPAPPPPTPLETLARPTARAACGARPFAHTAHAATPTATPNPWSRAHAGADLIGPLEGGKGGGGLSGGDGGGGDGGGGDGGGRDGGGRDDLSDRRGKSEIEAVVAPAHSRPCKQGRTQRQAPRHRRRRGAANNGDTPQERRLHRHYLALRCVPCHNARNCSAARRRGSQPDGRTSRDVRRGRR